MGDLADLDVSKRHKSKKQLKEPEDYKVILLNDDYTPMSFVVFILVEVFHKSESEAERIMLKVHEQGSGVAGVYPFDIARSKSFETRSLAAKENFPLECIIEKA